MTNDLLARPDARLWQALMQSSSFWVKNANNPLQFVLERGESFGYDPQLDYLTVANYNDGLPGSSQSWSYDAAGNRNDSTTDNLNRATSIGGVACTNDILGNRLTKGTNAYTWDILNRMLSFGQTEYRYRADGMRVQKTSGSNATRYRYDGQMGIEDVAGSVVTRYGLGARGVDYIEQSNGTGSSVVFPVYDAHGNNVASLSRDGMGYQVSNRRSFDAWGNVRLGAQTGDPTGRYCANLGHKQDDESGLVYMRARYYEPTSGRFVSEDPAAHGRNWFSYCANNPVSLIDRSGTTYETEMDHLMLQFANIIAGVGRFASNGARIREVMILMEAMSTYVGLEDSASARHFAAAQVLAGVGSVEGARIEQALGGEARASALVGRIYISQMMLGVVGILLEVF